jgi:hypothetical protein
MGLNALEADWVATDEGLHYVTPSVGSIHSFAWNVTSVQVLSRNVVTAELAVKSNGETMTWEVAKSAADRIIALAASAER